MSETYFHFTLGPVQAFVAQARRTRDFWAGSFLLSWLSSVAIRSVQAQGGDIAFPRPEEGYMAWLEGKGVGEPPSQGTIPNRFKAVSAKVDLDFNPDLVCQSVNEAWQALAELIWQADFAPLAQQWGDERLAATRQIWDRQVQGFWEQSWVMSPDASASNLLDRRKNCRSHLPPLEAGVKCMLMDGWQELSGLASPHRKGLDAFWETLRQGSGQGLATDIREGEALCALAFIKRRFSRHFQHLEHTMPGDWQLRGWRLPSSVPSLAHIAAGRWLENLVKVAGQQPLVHKKLTQFLDQVTLASPDVANEREAILPSIRARCQEFAIDNGAAELSGTLWFSTQLVQQRDEVLRLRQRHALSQALGTLDQLQRDPRIGTPHPYYAVLLMDGDSLGSQMSDPAKQAGISAALNHFTQAAPEIVRQHNGFLVYAGGDDVLALIGVSDAMACAAALRASYDQSFAEQNRLRQCNITSTLSGAINIGHIKWPLRALLFDAHALLDDVAKDKTGRDALAIRVWKHDKPHLCWSQPWNVLLDEKGNRLERLLTGFTQGVTSHGFLFKLQTMVAALQLDHSDHGLNMETLSILLRAEYLHSLGRESHGGVPSLDWFSELITLCTPHRRELHKGIAKISSQPYLSADGALLLRFLQDAYSASAAHIDTPDYSEEPSC